MDLDRFVTELYDSVVRFFRRRGFSHPEAQDLAQETFLKAHQGAEGFRGDAEPKTWVFVIATNVYRNELRRRGAARRSAKEVSLDEPVDAAEGSASLAERNGAAATSGRQFEEVWARRNLKRLSSLVPRLPPRMRCIFKLRMCQGRSYQEIAALLEVSIQTVKSQIHQARRRLEAMLEEGGGGDAGE